MENIEKKIYTKVLVFLFLFFSFVHFIMYSFLSGTEPLYKTLVIL